MLEPAPPQITWLLPRSPAMIPENTYFVGSDDLLTAQGWQNKGVETRKQRAQLQEED